MRTRTGQARPRSSRRGFTLVELLVVITIIAVLAALGTAAYQRVRVAGKRTATVSDINNMNVAITKFKQDFGFNPPQSFTFPSTPTDPGVALLQRMFRSYPASYTVAGPAMKPLVFMNLGNVNGKTISGSQCLLFFLGGPSGQGFDSTGPYDPAGTAKKGPYMDFDINRISSVANTNQQLNDYLDTWGTPYAYFSTGSSDGYDERANAFLTIGGVNIRPFKDAANKWVNSGGVQIISAGPNQIHGIGSVWIAPSGSTPAVTKSWIPEQSLGYGPGDPGEDDIGNFNGGLQLGSSSK